MSTRDNISSRRPTHHLRQEQTGLSKKKVLFTSDQLIFQSRSRLFHSKEQLYDIS
jgi:hypothetical protein